MLFILASYPRDAEGFDSFTAKEKCRPDAQLLAEGHPDGEIGAVRLRPMPIIGRCPHGFQIQKENQGNAYPH